MLKPAHSPSIVLRFRVYRALRCVVGPVFAFRLTLAGRAQA